MQGTISSVGNHGSIVIIWIDTEDNGSKPVYMDHRTFGWLVEGEGITTVGELQGRAVLYNGESIELLDNLEAA